MADANAQVEAVSHGQTYSPGRTQSGARNFGIDFFKKAPSTGKSFAALFTISQSVTLGMTP